MTRLTLLFLISVIGTACDSPLRHMEPENLLGAEDSTEILSLNDNYHVEIEWIEGPYPIPTKTSHLEVVVLDKDLKPTSVSTGDQFFIQADMGMGHGLASSGEFISSDLNLWSNEGIAFYMGGNYQITLYLFDENFQQIGVTKWRVAF